MKKNTTFSLFFNKRFLFTVLALGLIISASASAKLPTAQKIAGKMTVGWNLGNTLEAIGGEAAWGAGHTSQQLIDSVKAAGFNTVRLPVSWFIHSDTVTSVIDKEWIARVKEIVDYCIKDDLYVILNMHWDKGWLENRVNKANQEVVNKRQRAYWTQIANYFKAYDEHLLFASANEPNAHDSIQMSVLLTYHQTFVDAVRATGGKNSSRTLIVQGPSTDVDDTYKLMKTMPKDKIDGRMMAEVHYYTPFQFCLMEDDASWGKKFYYWGKDNHSVTDTTRNASWGEESDVDKNFEKMKMQFVDKGIPVIIGEFGASRRKFSSPSDQTLHNASVDAYYRYVVKSTVSKGLIPICWDVPGWLFNRNTGAVLDRGIINAIQQGYNDASKK
ncbi:MAG: glycoside hydrolase family 5 protein [Paludibacter sp.]|nr:glycoside hydrolase family 5 protein [Paludibacter sp.]